MGSKQSSQQNQTQTTYADPRAQADYDTVINKAMAAASQPYKAYSGELTAGNNYNETIATNQAYNQFAGMQDQYNAAKMYTTNAAGIQTSPTGVANNVGQYESPYTQDVIKATMAQAQQNDAIQNQQSTSNAIASHAFGGDRAGIAQGVLQGQQALANNQTVAGLNNQNYAQALSAAQNQQNVQLQNDQANRASIMAGGNQYANIQSAQNSAGLANLNAVMQGGVLQQQTAQAADTAKYGQFEQEQAFPYVQSNFLAGVTDATAPLYGSTSTGQNTTSTNGANSILGGVLGIAGLFSDERLKEDIKPVGKSFDGQTIHTFRYKDDPRAVHVGLMAQDVEKETPHAVGSHRGAKVVDYGEALRKAADKGHFARGGVVGMRPDGRLRFAGGGAVADPYDDDGQEMLFGPAKPDQKFYNDGAGSGSTALRDLVDQNVYFGGAATGTRGAGDYYGNPINEDNPMWGQRNPAQGNAYYARGGVVGSRPGFALGGSPYGGSTSNPYGSHGGTDPYSSQSFIPQTQIQPAKMLNNPLHFDSGGGGGGSDIGKTLQQGTKGLKGALGGGGGSSDGGLGGLGSSLTSGVSSLGGGVGDFFGGLGFARGGIVGMRPRFADGGSANDNDDDSGSDDGDNGKMDIGDLPDTDKSFVPDDKINPAKTLQSNMSFPSSGGGGGGSGGGGSSGGKGGGIMSMLGGLFADGGAVRPRRGYDTGGMVDDLAFPDPNDVQVLPEVTVEKKDDVPVVAAPKQANGVAPTAADLAADDVPKAGLGALDRKTDASSVPVPLTPGQMDGSQPMPVAPKVVAPTPDVAPAPAPASPAPAPSPGLGAVDQAQNANPASGPITDPNAPPVAVYPAQGPNAYQGSGPVPTAAAAGQAPATGGVTGSTPATAYADPQAPAGGGGLAAIDQAAPAATGNGVLGGASANPQDPYLAYTARVRGIENRSGDPYATSSAGATGTYQFIPSTFNGIARQHPELKLNDIHDPAQQERAMAQLTSDNKASLSQSLGRDPTPAELYLAHQQGAVAAAAMIKNPNARAIDLVSTPRAITGNGGSADMTAGQFAGMWAQRYDGTKPVVTAAGVPGNSLRGAPAPSGGVVGTSVNDPRSRGLLAQAGEDLSRTDAPPQHASDYFAPMLGGTGKYTEGHSGGLFGLFPGMSDNNRMALASLGFGMAASPSKSLGMALGQGGLEAVKTLQQGRSATREDALAKARIATDGSDIGYKQGQLAISQQTADNAAKELQMRLAEHAALIRASEQAARIAGAGGNPAAASVPPPPTVAPVGSGAAPVSRPTNSDAEVPATSVATPGATPKAQQPAASAQEPASTNTDANFWAKADPNYDPHELVKQAQIREAQANAYRASGSPQAQAYADQLSAQAARIRNSMETLAGKPVLMRDGTYQLPPSALAAETAKARATAEGSEQGKVGTQQYEMNKPVYEAAAKAKDDAMMVKANSHALRNLVFNPDGTTAVDTGPQGEMRAGIAAHLTQLGVPDKLVQKLTATDPSKAEAMQKISTDMVGEVARQSIGAGNKLDMQEYRNTIKGVPSNQILPKTIAYLDDHYFTPKSNLAINRYRAISGYSAGDLHTHNLSAELDKFDQQNAPDQVMNPQPSRPAAPAIGDVQKGYRFKGGDPKSATSWEKAS